MNTWISEMKEWCRGRNWPLRLLLLVWFGYLFFNHLRDPDYQSFLGGLNLGIHEFGHLICSPLGEFLGIAGGSLVQCLIPLISFVMFYRQNDWFAFSFSFVWLGSNLLGVARYMADARRLELNLVSPFGGNGEVTHDWNYLLHKMDLLIYDATIAGATRLVGLACITLGILWGGWIIWHLITAKKKEIGAEWSLT